METGTRYYDPTTGKYDRAAIMRDVWSGLIRVNIRTRLSLRLSVVWAHARGEKRAAEQNKQEREASRMMFTARLIEHKTTMTETDHMKVQSLRLSANKLMRAA
ncbi:MAG: hypothetical protein JJ979_02420 [Roseibium sp.]|nr:hypothetical protein [Roseibium sp.]